MTNALKPLPILDSLSEPWFAAAADGRFLIQRSISTGKYQWYPRAHVVGTLATDLEWVEAAGTGKIYSFTIVRKTANAEFAVDTPYVLALVELDEGVRVSTRIVDTPFERLACDMPVKVVFNHVNDEVTLPYFTAAGTR